MEIFAFDDTFHKEAEIDKFVSAIWHERYVGLGEAEIVVPATKERIAAFAEGKFIGKKGSRIPMQIETQSIEAGKMTLAAKSIENFFNERELRTLAAGLTELELTGKVGEMIGAVVQEMLIDSPFGGIDNAIPFLVVGAQDSTGDDVTVKMPFGPLYDGIKGPAETFNVGMAVYLTTPTPFSYELEFVTYTGADRTSDQYENDRVRFSPEEETLADIKELHSIDGGKNVAYVLPPAWYTTTDPVIVYAPGVDASISGFHRRIMVIDASDIQYVDAGSFAAAATEMTQRGKDALANNTVKKLMDGEVIPRPKFQYGVHYFLGDIIELVGQSGIPQKARVTEFIHSVDEMGEKTYPTVQVVS